MSDEQNYATVSGVKVHRSDFGYAPEGTTPSEWKLPLHDEAHVRNALARFNQLDLPAAAKAAAKAKLLARARKFGIDTSGFEKSNASEDPHFVFSLSDEATVRLPVAITGRWVKQTADGTQEISITLADMRSMIRNFAKKGNGEVNVDYDHKSETGAEIADPIPSAGRITALMEPEEFTDAQGQKRWILWGAYEPTERARQLIANKEYRYTSVCCGPGIDRATGKPQGMTLSTVALTNRPVAEQIPEIRLSDPGYRLMEAQEVHTDTLSGEAGEKGEEKMKALKLAKQADGEDAGKHLVLDGEEVLGHIPEEHLRAHAAEHFGTGEKEAACRAAEESARNALLGEIGAEGRTPAEIKDLIRRGAGVNQEASLLAETADSKGRIDTAKLDDLTDSGRVKPSAMRRALAAEARVAEAFKAGKIRPADLQRAFRLCLSDEAAFKAFIEDARPVVELGTQGVTRAADEAGKPATRALGEMISRRMAEHKESRDVAELNVIRTDEGLRLWNAMMTESTEKLR